MKAALRSRDGDRTSSNPPSSLGRSGGTSGNQVDAGEQTGPPDFRNTSLCAAMLESYARWALRSSELDESLRRCLGPQVKLRAKEHQEVLRSGVTDGCQVTVRSAPCSCVVFTSERLAKYNRLLEIEAQTGFGLRETL